VVARRLRCQFREAFQFGEFWYPIDFTALAVEALGLAAFVNVAFFLMDHLNLFDVVDFWNLRAAGMVIFPLPVEFYREYGNGVRAFATSDASGSLRISPRWRCTWRATNPRRSPGQHFGWMVSIARSDSSVIGQMRPNCP
jgi:hypothetical protein